MLAFYVASNLIHATPVVYSPIGQVALRLSGPTISNVVALGRTERRRWRFEWTWHRSICCNLLLSYWTFIYEISGQEK